MFKSLSHIDSSFELIRPSYTKSIVEVLLTKEIDDKFVAMINEYKATDFDDGVMTEDGFRPFHSLSLKREIFEKHFGLYWFSIQTQPYTDVTVSNLRAPVSVATIKVITDAGEEPWFSRTGMAKLDSDHADGSYADAETSAEGRIYAALGLGDEGISEVVFDEAPKLVTTVEDFMAGRNVKLKQLVLETNKAIKNGALTRSLIDESISYNLVGDIAKMETLRAIVGYIHVQLKREETDDVA